MDLFPDEQHVWLRSSGRGEMYLHADEDGVGVRVSSKRASLLSAWKVHHAVDPGGETYVLLYGAAYSHYLTASRDPAPHGHKGRLVIQRPYNETDFNRLQRSDLCSDLSSALSCYGVLDGLVFCSEGRVALAVLGSWIGASRLLREPPESWARMGFDDCRRAPGAEEARVIANEVHLTLSVIQGLGPDFL